MLLLSFVFSLKWQSFDEQPNGWESGVYCLAVPCVFKQPGVTIMLPAASQRVEQYR